MAGKSSEWQWVAPGLRVRECPDGQWEGQLIENVRSSAEAHAEMRKEIKGHIAKNTEAKECGLRLIGSMPQSLHTEMMIQCGHDQEKQKRFLHDHPECLVVPENSAPTKGRTGYSSPHHKRRS